MSGKVSGLLHRGLKTTPDLTAGNLQRDNVRNPVPDEYHRSTSRNGHSRQSQNQDGLLHIPGGGAARRPIETSNWDWDAPLEGAAPAESKSTGYYYEPQGELLHEQTKKQPGRNEFNIPHAVAGSGVQWPFAATPSPDSHKGDARLASQQQPFPSIPPLAGSKRKAPTDIDSGPNPKPSEPTTQKVRHSMSDSGEDHDSPAPAAEDKPPAQNTRSQAGAATRARRGTDLAGSREKAASSSASDAARPQGGAPRRALTDPAVPMTLPARKVFPIQIGDKLFRLSGASISSDGESIDPCTLSHTQLTIQEHPHISRISLKSSFRTTKALIT
jgi:hypothetical protein